MVEYWIEFINMVHLAYSFGVEQDISPIEAMHKIYVYYMHGYEQGKNEFIYN